MRRTFFPVITLLVLPAAVDAQGWIIPRCTPRPDRRPMPEPCVAGPQVVRTRSDVRVELVDRVLRYEIEERFLNRGATIGEADYLFPLPKGAAFEDLRLSINGGLVAGETMDAREARRIYEEIVRAHRDPALVEWMGHGLLRTRIFPFNAGEERRVVTRFQVVAEREGDAWRIDYFMGKARPNPRFDVRPVSDGDSRVSGSAARTSFVLTYTADASLGEPYSPTHELSVDRDGRRRRVTARGASPDVTVLLPLRRPGQASVAVIQHAPARDEDGFALITVTPPRVIERAPTPRDITLVLDVSGSMSGRKLAQAQAAGRQLLETLRPHDRFRLIDFSSDVRTFRDEFVHATDANIAAARRYIDELRAEGSTNISGALGEALRPAVVGERLPLVLFLTDGEPTVGLRNPAEIAARAAAERRGRRIFTFGVGTDVNVSLIEQLALEGRGTAHFVRPEESVERAVSVVASRLVDPVLTGIRVRADGVRLSRMHPEQPFDLFAGQDLVLFARYDGSGDARITFEGEAGRRTVRWSTPVRFAERERDNAFIARLWATQRVGYLSAERRKHGPSAEIDNEIRQLGERYGIPTELTSYFVKEPGMVMPANAVVGSTDTAAARRSVSARDASARRAAAARARSERAVATGSEASMAPPTAAVGQFEAARKAAEQRSAVTLGASTESLADANSRRRTIGSRTFELSDGRWVDTRHTASMSVVRVKAYSKAYFALIDAAPELTELFALGEKVVIAGRSGAVEIGTEGADELSPAEISRVVGDLGMRR